MARDLFTSPVEEWEYTDVDAFLSARIEENSSVEYKASHGEELVETLVSFANGESPGLIFIGVREKGQNRPAEWPLLEVGRDNLAPIYGKLAAETIPAPPVEARALEGPSGEREVVVVRVTPGPYPPYFGKGRGVMVRIADRDVAADPRTLEVLFARRADVTEAAAVNEELLRQMKNRSLPGNRDQFKVAIRTAPLGRSAPFPLNEPTTARLRALVRSGLTDFDMIERRFDDRMEFTRRQGVTVVTFRRDGAAEYLCGYDDPRGARAPVQLLLVFHDAIGFLWVAKRAHAAVAGHPGPLFLGIEFSRLEGRALEWPNPRAETGIADPLADHEPASQVEWTSTAFGAQSDARLVVREAVKALAWRLGYLGYEDYVDRWAQERDELA